jgi:murein DD-endopeptidase MepM/ murein hydrolase activator NlpD
MRRLLVPIMVGALVLALVPVSAAAVPCSSAASPAGCTGTPTPTPTSSTPPSSSGSGTGATATPTPASPVLAATPDPAAQRVIDLARQQLGSGVADSLAAVQHLSEAIGQSTAQQTQIQQRIDDSQAKLDALDQQIQKDSDDIAATQQRVDGERAQIGILARALYQEPDALLLKLLRAGSLRDMVTQTSDMAVAAVRADSLKQKLGDDLTRLQQDSADRQKAHDDQTQIQSQLNSALTQFQDLQLQLQGSSDQLQSLIDESRTTLDGFSQQEAATVRQATSMLLQRQQQLIATAENQVWQQAQLWATLNGSSIPPATTLGSSRSTGTVGGGGGGGFRFGWPIQGAVLTQGFGPTDFALEPAMFGFPHFHAGLDLASRVTRISAAADGVVAAVGSGTTGYGNYVIIVHGGGLVTLYGHLTVAMVKVGDTVTQGQQIGVEGSTGNSTGLHLHFEVRLNGTPVDPSPYLPPVGTA